MPVFRIDLENIPYEVRLSGRRRTIALKVEPSGEVVVMAPRFSLSGSIRRFVESRARWISNTRREFSEMARRHPPTGYRHGETFLFLGREIRLSISGTERKRLQPGRFAGGILAIRVPRPGRETAERVVRMTYEQATLRLVERLVRRHARALGVRPAAVKISRANGRWGSCSPTGGLRFNWRLSMAPRGVIEYLAVHELAHLKVSGHSSRFWRVVENALPDYRTRRRWLRDNGRRVMAY